MTAARRFGGFGVLERRRQRHRRDRAGAGRRRASTPARARRAADRARRHRRTSRGSAPTRCSASRWPPPAPPPRPPATPLYRHLNAQRATCCRVPLVNLINGGRHASNDLDFQEFIVMPVGADEPAAGAADRHRGQPRAGRHPARPLRQGRAQHRRRGRLRAADRRAREEALELLHEAVASVRLRRTLSSTASTAPRPTSTTRRRGTYTVAGERYDRAALIELYQRADRATSASSRSRIRCTRRTSRASPS